MWKARNYNMKENDELIRALNRIADGLFAIAASSEDKTFGQVRIQRVVNLYNQHSDVIVDETFAEANEENAIE